MRTSTDNAVKVMFTNKLSKTGNLTMAYDDQKSEKKETTSKKSKWGAALVAEKQIGKVRDIKIVLFYFIFFVLSLLLNTFLITFSNYR